MRAFQRTVLVLILALVCGHVARAQNNQNNETSSAGAGGGYDPSVCNDPSIAIMAKQQNATPYHDPNWNTPGDPLAEALGALAQEYDNPNINRAGACEHAPGVVFMVPNNLVPEVTKLIAQIQTSQPVGDVYNGSGNTPSSGQPSGSGPTGTSNGGTPASGANANPCEPDYNMSTAAGRAEAAQNAPQDQQACNAERCVHNPELSVCKTTGGSAETDPKPVPIVPGPAAPGPQPRRAGPSVPGPAMPTPVPPPAASVPPAATPPSANPGPTQQVNLWKGQFNCDGKNCVFVDQNGNKWAGPQVINYNGGVYQIDPTKFQVNRIRNSSIVQALATYQLSKLLPGYGNAPPTTTVPFNMQ